MRAARAPLARVLAAAALAAEVGAILLGVATVASGSPVPVDTYTLGGFVLGAAYPVVGWIVASRRPANATGWLLLAVGLSQALDGFDHLFSTYGLVVRPGSLPLAAEAAWLGTFDWAPGFVLLFVSVLVFPDGALPSRRWRPVAWAAAFGIAAFVLPTAIVAWPERGAGLTVSSPSGPAGDLPDIAGIAQLTGLALSALVAVFAVVGVAVRFRSARGVLRQQLKWFALAGGVEVVALAGSPVLVSAEPTLAPFVTLASALVAPLLPIAMGIAILRYRLYDIDRIVSRTISYAIVTALLAAAYTLAFVALEAALAPVTASGGPVAVATSTLVVFALFSPVRRWIAALVDRRFDRSRYDAERTVSGLIERLRNETDLRQLGADVEGTVRATLAPTVVTLWTRAK